MINKFDSFHAREDDLLNQVDNLHNAAIAVLDTLSGGNKLIAPPTAPTPMTILRLATLVEYDMVLSERKLAKKRERVAKKKATIAKKALKKLSKKERKVLGV